MSNSGDGPNHKQPLSDLLWKAAVCFAPSDAAIKMRAQPSLLWHLHRDDLPGDSYLFGTMHIRDKRAFGLATQVEAALQNCDALATEYDLDMNEAPDASVLDIFSPDQAVRKVLPEKTWLKLHRVLQKTLGMDVRHFQGVHPFVLINTISSMILSKDMPLSLDEYLWQLAKNLNKETLGIETLEEQLAIVQKIPIDAHVKNLAHLASNFSTYRRQTLKMAEWYARGDLAQLHRAAVKGQGSLKRLLLYERNIHMADRIEQMAYARPTLFAVGAGHLAGKYGLLRLLKFKGLKAKPLTV